MGGLFSSAKEETTTTRNNNNQQSSYGGNTSVRTYSNDQLQSWNSNISRESSYGSSGYGHYGGNTHIRTIPNYQSSQTNTYSRTASHYQPQRDTLNQLKISKYGPNYFPSPQMVFSLYFTLKTYTFEPVSLNENHQIRRLITNRNIIVSSIESINNPCLKTSYELRKKQKLENNPDVEELELFHGTKLENVDAICKNNFNWRYHGKGTGHRFGQGVSFSCNAMYAANYSLDVGEKVMFIAKVLIGNSCLGSKDMVLPDDGCDTSTKQNDHIVVVKYDDNEFYPVYRIKFHFSPDYVPPIKRRGSRYNRYR